MVVGNCQCPNFSSWKRGREALIKLVHTPAPNLIPYGEVIGYSRVSDSGLGRGVRLFKEICKKLNGPPELQENGLNQKSSNGMDIKNFFLTIHIMLTFR